MLINWLTTLVPNSESDESLILKNRLLSNLDQNKFKYIFFNKEQDISKNSIFGKFLDKSFISSKQNRPFLSDFLKSNLSDWIVISNSDVIYSLDFDYYLDKLDSLDIGFASAQRWDIESSSFQDLTKEKKLKNFKSHKFAKRQSKRTLDLFLIRKEVLIAILSKKENKNLTPGTVPFDNLFFKEAAKLTLTADLSNISCLLHLNHEDFRIPFKRNLILNLRKNVDFFNSRVLPSRTPLYGGCLTHADFVFYENKIYARKNFIKFFSFYYETLRIKIINNLEFFFYRINLIFFFLYSKKYIFFDLRLIKIFGFLVLFPSLNYIKNNEKLSSLENLLIEKFRLYKQSFN